jgi:lipoate-protein ligase A
MVQAFREEYHVGEPVLAPPSGQVQYVEAEDATDIPYIQDSMANFPGWDWAFGQTPEFTYSIDRSFGWGNVAAEIRSKHGLILSCSFTVEDTSDLEWLERLGLGLEGQRYGFLHNTVVEYGGVGRAQEVWQWLREEMAS